MPEIVREDAPLTTLVHDVLDMVINLDQQKFMTVKGALATIETKLANIFDKAVEKENEERRAKETADSVFEQPRFEPDSNVAILSAYHHRHGTSCTSDAGEAALVAALTGSTRESYALGNVNGARTMASFYAQMSDRFKQYADEMEAKRNV